MGTSVCTSVHFVSWFQFSFYIGSSVQAFLFLLSTSVHLLPILLTTTSVKILIVLQRVLVRRKKGTSVRSINEERSYYLCYQNGQIYLSCTSVLVLTALRYLIYLYQNFFKKQQYFNILFSSIIF